MTDRHDPMHAMEGEVKPLAERAGKASPQKSKQCKNRPPRPRVPIGGISRVLLRHAEGPKSETRLVVAVITLAIGDLRSQDDDIRQNALEFLQGSGLDHWASWVGLDGEFVRELARKGGYLPTDELTTNDTAPTEEPGRKDA